MPTCSMHVSWYIFLYVKNKTVLSVRSVLSSTLQIFAAVQLRSPFFWDRSIVPPHRINSTRHFETGVLVSTQGSNVHCREKRFVTQPSIMRPLRRLKASGTNKPPVTSQKNEDSGLCDSGKKACLSNKIIILT